MLNPNKENSVFLNLPIKSYDSKKICQFFSKKGSPKRSSDLGENYTIRFSVSENSLIGVSNS